MLAKASRSCIEQIEAADHEVEQDLVAKEDHLSQDSHESPGRHADSGAGCPVSMKVIREGGVELGGSV
jgi:hypothetical protein